jgi:hypothetical protein
MLRQLDDALWVADHAFRMLGLQIGTRTTIVRLSDGGLFVHSPGPLTVPLAKQLDELGPVRCIVAPNNFHHLFVSEFAKAYQGASVHLAPGLVQKRKDLAFDEELGDQPSSVWEDDIDQCRYEGAPLAGEVVFLHRASRTLILTDLSFNFAHHASTPTRLFLKLNAAYGRFTPSRMIKAVTRDREAARASLERILAWDFDRVVVSHGDVLEKGGREALRTGFDWLLQE